MDKNNNRIVQNALNYLDKVSTTGINEANQLIEIAVLLDSILKGKSMIIDTPTKETVSTEG